MSGNDDGGRDMPARDQRLKEWEECRTTIGRLDGILVDLRKYGFTLITGLLTAGSFIGAASSQHGAGVAAFVAVMCLVAALFSVDMYYSVLQSAAVERALNLEGTSKDPLADPRILVTGVMSARALLVQAKMVILGIYVFLLIIATGLAVISALTISSVSAQIPLPARSLPWLLVVVILTIGAVLLIGMGGYWIFVAGRTGMHHTKAGRDWPLEEPFVLVRRARMSQILGRLSQAAKHARNLAMGANQQIARELTAIGDRVGQLTGAVDVDQDRH